MVKIDCCLKEMAALELLWKYLFSNSFSRTKMYLHTFIIVFMSCKSSSYGRTPEFQTPKSTW
jgi:hypothetical protein